VHEILKNTLSNPVKRIHTDNGGEYDYDLMAEYLDEEGIELTSTAPYNPRRNGVDERANRTVMNKVREILLRFENWLDAVRQGTYLHNRTPPTHSGGATPYQNSFLGVHLLSVTSAYLAALCMLQYLMKTARSCSKISQICVVAVLSWNPVQSLGFRQRCPDGTIDRYQAILVALGCLQRQSGYDEIFSPVVDFSTVRTALTLAFNDNEHVHHVDVTGAFLHGYLSKPLYMMLPTWFEDGSRKICKLKESIHELMQAPRIWHQHLREHLSELNFKPVAYTECLFERATKNTRIHMLVYVDDVLLISKSTALIQEVKSKLPNQVQDHRSWTSNIFSRCQYSNFAKQFFRAPGRLNSRNSYIDEMLDCKTCPSPMDPCSLITLSQALNSTESLLSSSLHAMSRTAIGQLLYLKTKTKTDIAVAVGVLARQVSAPAEVHWTAVKRILRYLTGTMMHGLHIAPTNDQLIGHADANWGGESDVKSVSGFVITLGNVPVSWGSRKLAAVALSSTEAEYAIAYLKLQRKPSGWEDW
jgi:Reverse transcriptase (RNA-dependent DNA polymerase)